MKLARTTLAAGLAALLSLALATPILASDPLSLIRKSEAAEDSASYRGLKYADVVVGNKTIRAQFKIVHLKPNRTRTQYFAPSELNGIVTIERGLESWHFLPAQQKWQRSKWELAPRRISLALKNYRATYAGRGIVAGRPAYVVKLIPKKRGNPSETIWIDMQYYLPLKSELRNSSGVPISVSAFREIAFQPRDIRSSLFQVDTNVKPPNNPVPELGFKVVKPRYSPKGYMLAQVSMVPIGGLFAAHLMYTNGINTISIFERKRGGKDAGKAPSGFGKWANVLRFERGNIVYTIISDIDKRELRKIADSLK